MRSRNKGSVTLEDLKALVARLRSENGCPWDRKQGPENLKIYLLEETYELADALDRRSVEEIKEELGDLLFQVLFISRIFEEKGDFDLSGVIETIHGKMVRRHPHVFGQERWAKAEEVVQGWQEIKAREKKAADPFQSIPTALPALLRAHRIAQRAAGMGFEWPDIQAVLAKVHEEVEEIEAALKEQDTEAAQEELGDLLFTLVHLSRHLKTHAENALRAAIQKFLKRFRTLLADSRFKNQSPSSLSLEEWEALWNQAKKKDRKEGVP